MFFLHFFHYIIYSLYFILKKSQTIIMGITLTFKTVITIDRIHFFFLSTFNFPKQQSPTFAEWRPSGEGRGELGHARGRPVHACMHTQPLRAQLGLHKCPLAHGLHKWSCAHSSQPLSWPNSE